MIVGTWPRRRLARWRRRWMASSMRAATCLALAWTSAADGTAGRRGSGVVVSGIADQSARLLRSRQPAFAEQHEEEEGDDDPGEDVAGQVEVPGERAEGLGGGRPRGDVHRAP